KIQCILMNLSDVDVCSLRLKCLVMLERFDEALDVYNKVAPFTVYRTFATQSFIQLEDEVDAREGRAIVYNAQGDAALKCEQYTKAIDFYTKAIRQQEEAIYYVNRSVAYGLKQRWNDVL